MGLGVAALSPFLLAILAPALHRAFGRRVGWVTALLPLALFAYFVDVARTVARTGPLTAGWAWAPSLGVSLSFRADGLSTLFALLISGIGALVLVYAGGYMAGRPMLGRFYMILLCFMGAMLGLVLADDGLLLFVFWELTSVTSYLLIGFDHAREGARAAALQALLVTSAGGLCLLAGVVLLGQATGTHAITSWVDQAATLRAHPLHGPITILIVLGALTKSAQLPFHFWLPAAMEAPSPVSAYLHSATMVKAGIYLLARLHPALGGTSLWTFVVGGVGAATMIVGAVLAIQQTDAKRILAYATISVLGLLVHLLGLGTESAIGAAVVYLLAHAIYKAALFLVAGIVDHEAGTRDLRALAGLRRAMPVTAAAAGFAALSMAGVPPMLGFVGKEMVYQGTWAEGVAVLATSLAILASALLVAIAILVGIRPFVGREVVAPRPPHDPPPSMWLGPAVLASAGLLASLGLGPLSRWLATPAIESILRGPSRVDIALWHGPTEVLAASGLTLGLGIAIYAARRWLLAFMAPLERWTAALGPARGYDVALRGLMSLATLQTRLLQSGYLHRYVIAIVLAAVAAASATLAAGGGVAWPRDTVDVRFHELAIAALILLGALVSVTSRTGMESAIAAGVVGFGVALFYVLFGAPDLAMTQFAIETLTVILLVLVFHHLPAFTGLSSRATRARDAAVALSVGGLMTAFMLTATATHSEGRLSPYFLENSLPLGRGRNVVNVILVDFRALDTLGEITVLAVAAMGVFALLERRGVRS